MSNYGRELNTVNEAIDKKWAYAYDDTATINPYFDYFYTGEDVKVYIDGLEDYSIPGTTSFGSSMPISGIMWKVEQEKKPLYGYWSYTFDAVMYGTRIVTGAFQIITTSTNFMRDTLAKAAAQRAAQGKYVDYPIRGLTEDETNIQKYWTNTIDSGVADQQGQHLWSSHPPFNFVIIYGMQSVSLDTLNADRYSEELSERYNGETPLLVDTNERLVEADIVDRKSRTVLENVNLMSVQTEVDTNGTPISETYAFFAREVLSK